MGFLLLKAAQVRWDSASKTRAFLKGLFCAQFMHFQMTYPVAGTETSNGFRGLTVSLLGLEPDEQAAFVSRGSSLRRMSEEL